MTVTEPGRRPPQPIRRPKADYHLQSAPRSPISSNDGHLRRLDRSSRFAARAAFLVPARHVGSYLHAGAYPDIGLSRLCRSLPRSGNHMGRGQLSDADRLGAARADHHSRGRGRRGFAACGGLCRYALLGSTDAHGCRADAGASRAKKPKGDAPLSVAFRRRDQLGLCHGAAAIRSARLPDELLCRFRGSADATEHSHRRRRLQFDGRPAGHGDGRAGLFDAGLLPLLALWLGARDVRASGFGERHALPIAHSLAPGFELLVAGLLGGAVAYLLGRIIDGRRVA